MAVYIRKRKRLTEEDAQQASQTTQVSSNVDNSAEIANINQEIVKCQQAINIAEQRYQEEKKKQNANILQLQQKIADLGGTAISPATKNESQKSSFRLSKKLFEAVQRGKTEEFADVTKTVFDSLPNISYVMDTKECLNFAKKVIRYLNEQDWNDNVSHWDDLSKFIKDSLTKGNLSLSSREKKQILDAFEDELRERSMFSWIFGLELPEDPVEDDDIYDIDTEDFDS